MYNLVKSELYKLRYGKTYKGLIIFSLWCVLMTIIVSINSDTVHLELMSGTFNNRSYGFIINTFTNPQSLKGIEFFMSGLGWTPILIVGVMYLISFITCDEYGIGTYKNILTYGHERSNVYIAKLLTVYIGISVLICALPIITLFIGTMMYGFGVSLKINIIIQMVKTLGLIIIIFMGIVSLFMLLATIIKNKALIVTIGIVFLISPMFLTNMIPFEILEYHPIFMLMDICSQSADLDTIYKIIISSVSMIGVFTILGICIFNNQDIK